MNIGGLPEFYRASTPRDPMIVDESLPGRAHLFTLRERIPRSGSFHPHRGQLPQRTMLDEPQRLTMSDVFTLFGRHSEDTRWVASADSQEYLAVVLYLVQRNNAR
jgi:hypothetical protein